MLKIFHVFIYRFRSLEILLITSNTVSLSNKNAEDIVTTELIRKIAKASKIHWKKLDVSKEINELIEVETIHVTAAHIIRFIVFEGSVLVICLGT